MKKKSPAPRRIRYRGQVISKEEAVQLLENVSRVAFLGLQWDHPHDEFIGDTPER